MMFGDDWYSLGLAAIEREVERMVRSIFAEYRENLALDRARPYPLVDICETQDKLRITVDLTGLSPRELEVHVSSDLVVIEGEKKDEDSGGEKRRFICLEREFGPFRRVIEIPGAVNTGKIEARMKDGVLCLEMPRVVDRRVRRRKITIREEE